MTGGPHQTPDQRALLEKRVADLASRLRSSDCGTLAEAVVERLGGRTVGYFIRDNPTATLGLREDGHTFAVVDGRYLVDVWAKDVMMMTDRYVFDLHAPDNLRRVCRFWGSMQQWQEWTGREMIPFQSSSGTGRICPEAPHA